MKDEQSLKQEKRIIKRVLAGHKADYAQLVQANQQQIFAMIMRVVGNEETAKDLTQEVFIRAYNSLATFRGKSRFSTWLVRIAINRTNSHFSSRASKEALKTVSFEKEFVDNLASAVAEYGLLLRKSTFKEQASFQQAIELARGARGEDHEGLRAEFIRLVERASLMVDGTYSYGAGHSRTGRPAPGLR